MKKYVGMAVGLGLGIAFVPSTSAVAQSGHFVKTQACEDVGTAVQCSGKVAGLGGTTFEITVEASGIASVQCRNPGGNVAPGQDFEFDAAGTSGPLATPRNGHYVYTVETSSPTVPAGSCPNDSWTAEVVDVEFTEATIALTDDGMTADVVTVPVE